MQIEMGKEYVTKDGLEVRIYSIDGAGNYPVHGAIKENSGWVAATWTARGSNDSILEDFELIEKPKAIVQWLNIYPNYIVPYPGKALADECANKSRIACIRVEYLEGEGL